MKFAVLMPPALPATGRKSSTSRKPPALPTRTIILRTLLDAARASLSSTVRQEAVKVLGTLQQAYGDTDGGYVAVCDSPEEAKEHLKSRNAESLLPEWTKPLDNVHEASLYLLGDDYSLVLIYRKGG